MQSHAHGEEMEMKFGECMALSLPHQAFHLFSHLNPTTALHGGYSHYSHLTAKDVKPSHAFKGQNVPVGRD